MLYIYKFRPLRIIFVLLFVLVTVDPCQPLSGKMILTEENTLHSSPGYQQDGNGSYSSDLECTWYIHAPEGNVRRRVVVFKIKYDNMIICFP